MTDKPDTPAPEKKKMLTGHERRISLENASMPTPPAPPLCTPEILEKEWISQDADLDYRNWLQKQVIALRGCLQAAQSREQKEIAQLTDSLDAWKADAGRYLDKRDYWNLRWETAMIDLNQTMTRAEAAEAEAESLQKRVAELEKGSN